MGNDELSPKEKWRQQTYGQWYGFYCCVIPLSVMEMVFGRSNWDLDCSLGHIPVIDLPVWLFVWGLISLIAAL